MARDCIIGGGRAGSREHIFPATLGGRRTNKGIYCGHHNNAFSSLAGAISLQLKPINSLLGIRSDHSNKPHTMSHTAPSGKIWTISASGVSSDDPDANDALEIQLTLGGPDGLKAVAYIALTFFAHHFPDEARQPAIKPIKDYVQGRSENDFAWWEEAATLDQFPANKFKFGHTIGISTSVATGEIFAFISFFCSLSFGIHIGTLKKASNRTLIVFIDPHAEHAPDDIFEIKKNSVEFSLKKPNPLHLHLAKSVSDHTGEGSLQRLLANIEKWKFSQEMDGVLQCLNMSRALSEIDRQSQIVDVVEKQTTRVHRLLVHFGKDFKKNANKDQNYKIVSKFLENLVARDPSDQSNLSAGATQATKLAMSAIAKDLEANLSRGDIDMDYLWFLFSGTNGMKIAAGAVLDHLQKPRI